MSELLLTIGELARRTGIAPSALRDAGFSLAEQKARLTGQPLHEAHSH